MTLAMLLQDVEVDAVRGPTDREISSLCHDSRRLSPGAVFFGLAGLREDGARFARQALAAGATAVVVARGSTIDGATVVEVAEPRKALAQAAARFHGHPERALRVVGVTGTNGKTTTTWMLESIFRTAGLRTGVIGTTGVRFGDERRPAPLTTPESPELFGLLSDMVGEGVQVVAIEVSSHALVQRRAYGLACEVAVFTNLSHDHLDYHGTMERYLDAKLMLFDGRNLDAARGGSRAWTAVVDADDPASERVCSAAESGGATVASFGEAEDARCRIAALAAGPRGLSFALDHDGVRTPVTLPLLGRHNAWNAAAAFAAARAMGITPAVAAAGLATMPAVPGRLERVDAGQPFLVVVDYAHTPDALTRALAAAREHGGGRVLVVFGCGGDRDRAKRPEMGRVAAAASDLAWLTSDNPRGEDPAAIAADVLSGAPPGRLALELDRRAAIVAALTAARAGDAVLIAGKGHETTQTIGDRVIPFDDRIEARQALAALATGRP